MKLEQATFDFYAASVLNESLEIQAQRGTEYGDTWALENMNATFTQATLARIILNPHFDGNVTLEEVRLIIMAALVDVKDSRVASGDWKKDSVVDGINYRAVYAGLREEYEEGRRAEAVARKESLRFAPAEPF